MIIWSMYDISYTNSHTEYKTIQFKGTAMQII